MKKLLGVFGYLITAFLAFLSIRGEAQQFRSPHVSVEFFSPQEMVSPERPFFMGLTLRPDENWHVYWKNSGDSGAPPKFDFTLPPALELKKIHWPTPRRVKAGPFVNFGYRQDTTILFEFIFRALVNKGDIFVVNLRAEWLVCKEECVPGTGSFSQKVKVTDALHPPLSKGNVIQNALEAMPSVIPELSIKANFTDSDVTLTVRDPFEIDWSKNYLEFFPEEDGIIDYGAEQFFSVENRIPTLRIKRPQNRQPPPSELRGVLVSENGWGKVGVREGVEIKIPFSQAGLFDRYAGSVEIYHYSLMLLFAFIGGVLLNFMPCVFPILSLKVLSVVDSEEQFAPRDGVYYAAGIVVSLWILASFLFALQEAGEKVGWGFQLQSPIFLSLMILFIFGLGLNFLGAFEVGAKLQRFGAAIERHSESLTRSTGTTAFASGVLAALLATPCTAPFMGTALAAALSLPKLYGLLLFTVLGLGMACPYIILAFSPALLTRLPTPGTWMVALKQFLGFPLFGTCLWLLWVLAKQSDENVIIAVLSGCLIVGLGTWLVGRFAGLEEGRFQRGVVKTTALSLFLVAALLAVSAIRSNADPAHDTGNRDLRWEDFTEEKIVQGRVAHRPVFVDFTAAWCITCQVNKKLTLESVAVIQKMKEKNVLPLRADWTNGDPTIGAVLEGFDRRGVPVNILFPPEIEKDPIIFPTLLTPGMVLRELEKL